MGVKFNRDKTWVGSTSCLWPSDRVRIAAPASD